MLDFDQELKKFKPCMDISDVEDEATSRDLSDVLDLMRRRNGSSSGERRKEGSYDSRRR
ncbi:MAG: hypothetical protein U0L49_04905 [Eubacterium sp.]|nr:hypothetical protein [Eubacterium sp.]